MPERSRVAGSTAWRGIAIAWGILLSILGVSQAAEVRAVFGTCVGVKDGDSLILLVGGLETEVRLDAIDAPEIGQAFSAKAKQALSTLAIGKSLRIDDRGRDRYGRVLARLYLGEVELNKKLVESGYAWHFQKYSNDPALAAAEAEARKAKRGLWVDPHPEAPWLYRERHLPRTPPPAQTPQAESSSAPLHGNINSRVFHTPSCVNYSCWSCVREFKSTEEALAAGYRPAQCCAAKQHDRR